MSLWYRMPKHNASFEWGRQNGANSDVLFDLLYRNETAQFDTLKGEEHIVRHQRQMRLIRRGTKVVPRILH